MKLLSSEQLAVSRIHMHTSTEVYESIRCYIPCNYSYIKCTHTHTLNHWHKEAEDEDGTRPVLFWVFCLAAMSSPAEVRPTPVTNIPWDPAEQNKQSSKWSVAIFNVHVWALCQETSEKLKSVLTTVKPMTLTAVRYNCSHEINRCTKKRVY